MLTAKLILERINERGRLLERREQKAHSFTRGLIDLLYVASSQLQLAAPYSIKDIDNTPRDVDVQPMTGTGNRSMSCHLRMGSPAGQGSVQVDPGTDTNPNFLFPIRSSIIGNDLGIQVGIDNTGHVPTDRRLGQRIGHGRRPADGVAALFESYAAGEDTSYDINAAANWAGQEFIPAVSHRVTSVWIKIYKAAAPGNLTVRIRAADFKGAALDYVPSQTDLASGTILEAAIPGASPGALTQCVFATPVDLYAGHRYYIVINAPGAGGANHVYWRYDTAGATYLRAFQTQTADTFTRRHTSADSGVTWAPSTNSCFMFEEWGQSVGEFEYGGCDLSNINFPAGTGEFTIRRYMENHSGFAITVYEVGIAAAGLIHAAGINYPYAVPFLIARDRVVGGIAVADGELLRVTYVPHIAV